jgi:hypothetical protein
MHRRLAATSLAVLTLAAACGSGDEEAAPTTTSEVAPAAAAQDTGSPVEDRVLQEVLWATNEAGSAVVTFDAETVMYGEPLHFSGEGLVDFTTLQGHLVVDMREMLDANGFEEVGSGVETVFDGEDTYIRADMFDQVFSLPTPWFLFDLTDVPAEQAMANESSRGLMQLAGVHPAMGMQMLGAVEPGSSRDLGTDTVDGRPVTRYRATVDLGTALAGAAEAARAAMTDRLGSQIPVEFAVDGEGRLVQATYHDTDSDGQVTPITVGYQDFGADAAVTVPGDDEVGDLFTSVPLF